MRYLYLLILFSFVLLISGQDTVKVAQVLTPEQLAEVDYNNGLLALTKNDFNTASELFSKCLTVKPNFDKAFANRSIAYTKLQKYNEALADVNIAIKLADQNPDYFYNKSLVCFALNQKDSQDVALDKCLAINGEHTEAAYYKALLYFERKEYNKAIGYYNIAIKTKPTYAYAFNDRASAKRALGDLDGAILDYSEALLIDSSLVFIYNNLGSALREKKNYELAITAYTKAFKLNPKYLIALINRGGTYFDMSNYKAAQADFEEVLSIDGRSSFAYNNLSSIALKNKDYKKAKDLATRAIELDPSNGPAYYNRGIAGQMLREEAACCADWKKAHALGIEGAKAFIYASCMD